jgi:ribosomal RNA-processing protein 12
VSALPITATLNTTTATARHPQADEAEFDRRSRRSSGAARTARASEWGHTAIFSNEDDGDGQTLGGRSGAARSAPAVGAAGGARSVAGGRGGCRQQQQQQQQRRRGLGGGMQLAGDGSADPQDLLEPSTVRQLVKAAAGAGGGGAAGSAAAAAAASFPRGDDGRYVIREEDGLDGRKRQRGRGGADDGFGSDHDSDMEDMRGFAGLDAAIRSVANAKSVRFAPTIAASLGNRSAGQRSNGTARSGGSGKQQQQQQGGRGNKQHSGDRFRPKAAGTAGDVKGRSSVDPYAYWSFDKKMLNRRRGKQAAASKGLSGVVAGAQAGALKGAKAKRAAQAAKRQRR